MAAMRFLLHKLGRAQASCVRGCVLSVRPIGRAHAHPFDHCEWHARTHTLHGGGWWGTWARSRRVSLSACTSRGKAGVHSTTVTAARQGASEAATCGLRTIKCPPQKSKPPAPSPPHPQEPGADAPRPLAPPVTGDPQEPPTPPDPSLHVLAITCDSFSPTYAPKLEWKPPRLEVSETANLNSTGGLRVRRTRAANAHISESADEPASDEHGTCHLAERTEGTCGIIDSRRPAAQAGRAGVLDPRPHLPSHADWAGASRDSRG